MASKDEEFKAEQVSPHEEQSSPKKRRKVNHGGYDELEALVPGDFELTRLWRTACIYCRRSVSYILDPSASSVTSGAYSPLS